MLDEIKERLDNLIVTTNDAKKLDRYHLIKRIISYNNGFTNMDVETAICILEDLNFSSDMAREIYLELLKEEYGWNIQAS